MKPCCGKCLKRFMWVIPYDDPHHIGYIHSRYGVLLCRCCHIEITALNIQSCWDSARDLGISKYKLSEADRYRLFMAWYEDDHGTFTQAAEHAALRWIYQHEMRGRLSDYVLTRAAALVGRGIEMDTAIALGIHSVKNRQLCRLFHENKILDIARLTDSEIPPARMSICGYDGGEDFIGDFQYAGRAFGFPLD